MWTTSRFPAPWLLPALLPVALMTLYPVAYALWTSLHSVMLLFWVLPGAISAVLWIWVFHPSFGVLNGLLRDLHLIDSSIPWLTSPRLALISVVIAHVWTQIPFAVVLIMAALA